MPRKTLIALPVAVALVFGLVVGVTQAKVTHKARVAAAKSGALKINNKKLRVKHGKVTIVFRNPKGTGSEHGVAVEGHGVEKEGKEIEPGHTTRLHVRLKEKGRYTFYCPVDGHRLLGMKGKLIVK